MLSRQVPGRHPVARHERRAGVADVRADLGVREVKLRQRSGDREREIHRARRVEKLGDDAPRQRRSRRAERVDAVRIGRVPPLRIAVAVVVRARHRFAAERAELHVRLVRSRQISEAEELEHHCRRAARHAVRERRLQRALRDARDRTTERVHRAERVGVELHRHRVGAVVLLEVAGGVAPVEVHHVAVVTLLSGLTDAVAADDVVAGRVAVCRVRRLALLALRGVHAAVAADRSAAPSGRTYRSGAACRARRERRSRLAFLPGLAADDDAHARLRLRAARVRVGTRVRDFGARECAVGLAASAGTIERAEVALLAVVERAVAAQRGATAPAGAGAVVRARRSIHRRRADDALLTGVSAHGDARARARPRADVLRHA